MGWNGKLLCIFINDRASVKNFGLFRNSINMMLHAYPLPVLSYQLTNLQIPGGQRMDKKNLDAIRAALKSAGVKTAAALRSLLAETDAFAAAPAESLTARGRIAALFDEGTVMESGA